MTPSDRQFYKLPDTLDEDIKVFGEDVQRFLNSEIPEPVFKAKRVPRGVYEQRQNGSYMVRVRIAGGTVTSEQVRTLARLSREYASGSLHVTTRQDIQIHDVKIENTPEIMRQLRAVGLTSKGGGGNTVRNVAACPYSGVCPAQVFDVTPFAHAVTEFLIPLVGSYNLPRKYKIAFSACAAECSFARVCDLGFIAEMRDGKPGFLVYAGGGMGAQSRAGDIIEEWIPTADTIRLAEAVRRVFDKHGDRTNKSKARLRFVFDRLGTEAVRDEIFAELATLRSENAAPCNIEVKPCNPSVSTKPPEQDGSNATAGLRTVEQLGDDMAIVPLRLSMGFITADDMERLADIAEKYSGEQGMRTTREQNLLIRSVLKSDLPKVAEELGSLEQDLFTAGAEDHIVACAGASTCRLGLCLSRNLSTAVAEELDANCTDTSVLKDIAINISGCPNSCGHHPMGGIGLFGAAQRSEGRLVPSYRLVIGASNTGRKAHLANAVGAVPARSVPAVLTEVINGYISDRQDGEAFADYCERRGGDYFEGIVSAHRAVPAYEDDPDFYRDWGMTEDFSLAGRGAGECGAGVFDVIRGELAQARKNLESGEDAYGALLPASRALLITRGVDAQDPDTVFRTFEEQFIDTGLVADSFRGLMTKARGYLQGWKEAFADESGNVSALIERVDTLFSTLDANLVFHPPEGDEVVDAGTDDEGSGDAAADVPQLDLRGVACPMNFVKTKLRLEMMDVEALLEVILDDGEPIQNVPASLKGEGQEIVETEQMDGGLWRILVRKKN